MLDAVGLAKAADRRVKGYSMGMRQRLAIAAALLGDPEVLILDEPANGLDPPGIRWMRDLLRAEAARGRAVLVSSHLLSEVAQSVDDVVVISRGRAARQPDRSTSVLGSIRRPVTRVRSARAERPRSRRCASAGWRFEPDAAGALLVRGTAPSASARSPPSSGIALSELVAVSRSLEDAFFELTEGREMSALLQAELIKLRTTRTFAALPRGGR